MPQDIEEVFHQAGLSLFPERSRDLETDCSCPDWSNPCKHIAAVYYLLGEEFDRDPFLIFKLRGMDARGIPALLGAAAACARRFRGKSPSRCPPMRRHSGTWERCRRISESWRRRRWPRPSPNAWASSRSGGASAG